MSNTPSPNRDRLYAFLNSPGFIVSALLITVALLVSLALILRWVVSTPATEELPTGTPVVVVVQVTAVTPATPAPVFTSTALTEPAPQLRPSETLPPTLAPTHTPSPMPTMTPTPTPIPLPVWRSIGDLGIVEYVLATEAEAKLEKPGLLQIFGADLVRLYAVGKIRVGLDLTGMSQENVQRHGAAITVTLPPVTVLGVEMLPEQSEIRTAERSWIYSEYEGLELAAMDLAKRQLAEMVANNDSMMSLARELTLLRVTEYLRSLGFEDIVIRFSGS